MLTFNKEVGYPTNQEKGVFVEYLLSFYSDKPEWDAVYPEIGMGSLDAVECMEIYLGGHYESVSTKGEHLWGGGDSIDRENVRDIFLQLSAKSA